MLRDNRDAKMDIPRTALTGCGASIVGPLTSGFSPTTTFRHQESWQLTGSEDSVPLVAALRVVWNRFLLARTRIENAPALLSATKTD